MIIVNDIQLTHTAMVNIVCYALEIGADAGISLIRDLYDVSEPTAQDIMQAAIDYIWSLTE